MGGDAADNLKVLLREIKTQYRALAVPHVSRFNSLKMSMISTNGGVRLKGKGGELRHLGQSLHLAYKKFYDASISIQRKIELALRTSCRMESILDEHKKSFALPGAILILCRKLTIMAYEHA